MTKKLTVISVVCRPPDKRIHLAPTERGSTNVLTLCLEKWKKKEQFRKGCKFCPECFEKWREKGRL